MPCCLAWFTNLASSLIRFMLSGSVKKPGMAFPVLLKLLAIARALVMAGTKASHLEVPWRGLIS